MSQAMTATEIESGRGHLCGALKHQPEFEGETCKRPAGWGTTHPGVGKCKLHGGSTRNHARFAEMEMARQAVELWGGRKDIHPAQALLDLVQTKAQEVAYWRYRVTQIPEEDLTWGTSKVKTGGDDYGTTEEAKPHIALASLWARERELADYSSMSIKAGVDVAMVQLAQAQADKLFAVLQAFLLDPRVSIAGDSNAVVLDALKGLEA